MANSEHVKIIKQGVDAWNSWRERNEGSTPDLAWANLIGLNLEGVNFSDVNLKLAFCRTTNFSNADLRGSNLYGTNFQDSRLESAQMQNTNLEGANLIKAELKNANLEGANLKLAQLDNADCEGTNLLGTSKLSTEQLLNVRTLSKAKIETALREKLKESNPRLFDGE